jgi:diaminohydroxyphosphoribosylaminopyrimidine deaminase / 5-amino-6-(5-phosphoribosylamino)uracil reductase
MRFFYLVFCQSNALLRAFFIGEIMNETYMKRAIELANQATILVAPNPKVGAVIVKDGRIIGEGYHQQFGGPHAEVHAFNHATEDVFGASMYVTLEPCSHEGKTPACAKKIIEKGIKEVYIGSLDPNPLVAGKGVQMLKDAGIKVHVGLLEETSHSLNPHFFYYITQKTPYVMLKMAQTLDGKFATQLKHSKWITDEHARHDVHVLRQQYQAILVGINTVLEDNPLLTVRLSDVKKQPIRVVLDTHGRIPLDANVLNDQATTIVFTYDMSEDKASSIKKMGHTCQHVSLKNGVLDLHEVLIILGQQQISSVLVEGGKSIYENFLNAQLAQAITMYIAPKLIGGTFGLTHLNIDWMDHAITLHNVQYDIIHDQIKLTATL